MVRLLLSIGAVLALGWGAATPAYAQAGDVADVVRAEAVRVLEVRQEQIPGTDAMHTYQTVEARLLEGDRAGDVVTITNDFLELTEGDRFFATHYVFLDGTEQYSVQDIDRRAQLYILIGIFAAVIIVFGGWYGVRSLVSLVASLYVLAYVLVPGLVAGWNPLLASFAVSSAILGGALFFTHGFNRESLVAFSGTAFAVACTLFVAAVSVSWAELSGFSAEESVSLNFGTRGALDLAALLVGGIVIGALGVLDDIAITQVAVVRELWASNSTASPRHIFMRAMRVGREHVGAVVNTLALAYVGVSLPLVLVMHLSPAHDSMLFNMEIVATEIVRTVVGSIGIVLTVPVVTLLAVRFLRRTDGHGDTQQTVVHSHH
jgi:uncharacterized membrane protein